MKIILQTEIQECESRLTIFNNDPFAEYNSNTRDAERASNAVPV
jgi:hypothetical protein